MISEIKRTLADSGLSKWELVGEFLAGICVFAIPILMLFIGAAFGL